MSQIIDPAIAKMLSDLIKNAVGVKKYLERMQKEIRVFFNNQTDYENFCNPLNQCFQTSNFNKLELIFKQLSSNNVPNGQIHHSNFISLLMICDYIEEAQECAKVLIHDQRVVKLISNIKRDKNNAGNSLELDYKGICIKFGIHDDKGDVRTTNSLSNAYQLEGDERGYFYIVVNVPMIGALKQMCDFAEIFHTLKFKVRFRINVTESEIRADLEEMLPVKGQTDDHWAFIFYYLGHGSVNAIDGYDANQINRNHLTHSKILKLIINSELYTTRKSVTLINDCCKIRDIEFTVNSNQFYNDIVPSYLRGINILLTNQMDPADALVAIEGKPPLKDILVCNSTQEGYNSFIDSMEGTLFGRNFKEMLIKNAIHRNLIDIFTKTSESMEEEVKRQYPNHSDFKKFYNPIDPRPNGSRKSLYLGMNINWDNTNSDYSTPHIFKPN